MQTEKTGMELLEEYEKENGEFKSFDDMMEFLKDKLMEQYKKGGTM